MTIWDRIYKNYQQNGEVWATLSEGIHPLFKVFLSESNFGLKYVLDIGCGTGKYLEFLQSNGFKTDGIDSSEAAVEMTRKVLNANSAIICKNMFEFDIPNNKYDLIISISTIHHGTKKQVQSLINKIHEALVTNGKVFITLPDFNSVKRKNALDVNEEIEIGTFVPLSGHEKGLPHSFYTKKEVQKLFSKFKNIKLDLDEIGRWVVRAYKQYK